MKQFYTVRDIEDMHAAGVVDIETHDDVVLTDVAREKAIALGMHLKPVAPTNDGRQGRGCPAWPLPPGQRNRPPPACRFDPNRCTIGATGPVPGNHRCRPTDRVMKIKAAVVARLGTDKYNDLLDKIIPQVMSQIKK